MVALEFRWILTILGLVALGMHGAHPKLNIDALSVGLMIFIFLPWVPRNAPSTPAPGSRPWRQRLLLPAAVVCCSMCFLWFAQKSLEGQDRWGTHDFTAFYSAGVQVFVHGGSPYDLVAMREWMARDYGVQTSPFVYPPWSVVLFAHNALLGFPAARSLLLASNQAIVMAVLCLIPWRLLRGSPSRPLSLMVCLLFVFFIRLNAVWQTLKFGQINLLLLLFILMFWILARERRPAVAGLFLALAILLKTYPIIIVPALFCLGRRREVAWTSGWLGLAAVVSLFLPGEIWWDWAANVLPTSGYMRVLVGEIQPAHFMNHSLNAVIARLMTENAFAQPLLVNPGLARISAYIAASLVLISSGVVIARIPRDQYDTVDQLMVIALPAMFLIAPFSWDQHIVYLTPVVILLLTAIPEFTGMRRWTFHLVGVVTAVLLGLQESSALSFHAVLVLWLLGIVAVSSRQVRLTTRVDRIWRVGVNKRDYLKPAK